MIQKYNEMYGEDAYEQDSNNVDESLIQDGRRIRHLMLIPEMSSCHGTKKFIIIIKRPLMRSFFILISAQNCF